MPKNIWWKFHKDYLSNSCYNNSIFNCYGTEWQCQEEVKHQWRRNVWWWRQQSSYWEMWVIINFNLSLHPLIITPWLRPRLFKLCTHWWETSVTETKARSVKWKKWVTMPVFWWDITIRYVLQIWFKLLTLWIICSIISHFFFSSTGKPPYQKSESVDMIRLNPQQLQNKSVTRNLFPPTEDYFLKLFPINYKVFFQTNATTYEGMQMVARHYGVEGLENIPQCV